MFKPHIYTAEYIIWWHYCPLKSFSVISSELLSASSWGINLRHQHMLSFFATDPLWVNEPELLKGFTTAHGNFFFLPISLFPSVCVLCSLSWKHLVQGLAFAGQIVLLGTATQTQTDVSVKFVHFEKWIHFYPSEELPKYGVFSNSSSNRDLIPESFTRLTV